MTMDFNDAEKQRSIEPIPHGTVADVQIKVRAGNAGEDGWLKRSKDGNSEALDCEFLVVGGPHDKRKFWELMTLAGTTSGHATAMEISRAKLRAILECARGVQPNDTSEEARQARQITSYGEFNGLLCTEKIGIEKGGQKANGDGAYPDKNRILEVITPDKKEWHALDQSLPATTTVAVPAAAAAIAKPAWAS
jgi:hypothetical protein